MDTAKDILILVHPGSTCGSADFNLSIEAGPRREALAAEIHAWPHDMLIVYDSLSDELAHYAILGLVLENAYDKSGRRVVRENACDETGPDWPDIVGKRFRREWPGGPHRVIVTGAWYCEDGTESGCVNAVVDVLADQQVAVSDTALRI